MLPCMLQGIEGSSVCAKPCLVFTGDLFETDTNYIRLKNLLIGMAGSGRSGVENSNHYCNNVLL